MTKIVHPQHFNLIEFISELQSEETRSTVANGVHWSAGGLLQAALNKALVQYYNLTTTKEQGEWSAMLQFVESSEFDAEQLHNAGMDPVFMQRRMKALHALWQETQKPGENVSFEAFLASPTVRKANAAQRAKTLAAVAFLTSDPEEQKRLQKEIEEKDKAEALAQLEFDRQKSGALIKLASLLLGERDVVMSAEDAWQELRPHDRLKLIEAALRGFDRVHETIRRNSRVTALELVTTMALNREPMKELQAQAAHSWYHPAD
jgi:hypothetical protein